MIDKEDHCFYIIKNQEELKFIEKKLTKDYEFSPSVNFENQYLIIRTGIYIDATNYINDWGHQAVAKGDKNLLGFYQEEIDNAKKNGKKILDFDIVFVKDLM